MGQLVSDGTLGYVWVTDETSNGSDVVQNLNLAVSDPASQPYVTAVGGTSFGARAPTLGPPPTETRPGTTSCYYSEGAGGGGISQTFAMPAYQQALGTVTGSSGMLRAERPRARTAERSPTCPPSPTRATATSCTPATAAGQSWLSVGGTSAGAPLWRRSSGPSPTLGPEAAGARVSAR